MGDRDRDTRWLAAAVALAIIGAAGYVLTDTSGSDRAPNELVLTAAPAKEPDPTDVMLSPPYRPVDPFSVDRGSLDRLFRREHEDVAVRAYWSESRRTDVCGPGPCPPPRCLPSGAITAGLSTKAAVGNGLAFRYDDPIIPLVATSGYIGTGEDAPVAWAIVQVARGTNAKTIRVDFADGATDEMKPKRGIAVLVHVLPAGRELAAHVGDVEAVDEAGKVVATRQLVAAPGPDFANREMLDRAECAPRPPPLPEPNGPPPADEPRARDLIVQAYSAVYNGSTTDDEKAARVQDPRGVKLAFETARRNFADALAKVTIRINEVRFLNPAEAAVAYDIVIPNYSIPEFPGRQGRAVLDEGTWKVAHATVCTDLQLAGASC